VDDQGRLAVGVAAEVGVGVTVPSSATIAKWRHVVRVLIRLVGVPLVVLGAIMLATSVPKTMLDVRMMGTRNATLALYLDLNLAPVLVICTGVALFIFDKKLARFIVPKPSKGCPNCGYWIGSRPMDRCPECGVELTGDAP
jgi:hypothetical protein